MSSPDFKARRRFLVLAGALPLLAGCSFSPLYGNGTDISSAGEGFAYAKPGSRLEQIVYQELSFRLGQNPAPDATEVVVSLSTSTRGVGRTSAGSVLALSEYRVTAMVTVVSHAGPEPAELMKFTRFATAQYEVSGQVANNNAAIRSASEKAARAVADSIRLVLAAARNNGEI